jgi:hypothetical protein
MGIGIFTDKEHRPTDDEVLAAIVNKLPLWQELIRYIREKYPVQEDFKFLYGKNYGWALRFRIKGQLLTSLYPVKGGFTAQINLSSEAVEKAQSLKPGKNVQQAIAQANPYPEGRWLFVNVESEKDLRDIQRLLALRTGEKQIK